MLRKIDYDRFIQEIRYGYDNVPFYQAFIDEQGTPLEHLLAEGTPLAVPMTQKVHYRRNFPKGVLAKGYTLNNEVLSRSKSSGTAGDRLMTVEVGMLWMDRADSCTAIRPEIHDLFVLEDKRICRYAPPNCSDVECANPNSVMADRLLSDGTLVLPVYHDLLTTTEAMIRRAVAEIHEYKPDLYLVDPTHFAFLLREAKKLGLTLPNVPVMATYSASTELVRAQIQSAFDHQCCYSELVSCSEMGWMAMECDHGHIHLNSDAYFFELVRDGRHVNPGEVGELVITSIDQGALPHLRYQTGDALRLDALQCDCGLDTPSVKMEGRIGDFIKLDGRCVLSPRDVDGIFGAPKWLDMYQVHQLSDTRIAVKLIVNETYIQGDEQPILDTLSMYLGDDVTLTVDKTNYIASERSGKFKAVKSDVEVCEPVVFADAMEELEIC